MVVAAAEPSCTETTAPITMAGATTGLRLEVTPADLFTHHLDHQSLRAAAVELAVEDRLPRPQVELPVSDRQDDLVVHQQVLQMRVAVVLAAAVVPVVAGVGQELARYVVRRLLPARRRDLVEPLQRVLLETGLVVVHPDGGGDVHRRDEHHPLRDAGLVDGALHVLGDPDELAPAPSVEGHVLGVRLHQSSLVAFAGSCPPWRDCSPWSAERTS